MYNGLLLKIIKENFNREQTLGRYIKRRLLLKSNSDITKNTTRRNF